MLIGQYIPNFIAQPFDISHEYIEIIYGQTQSPRLEKVLKKWNEDDWGNSRNRQKSSLNSGISSNWVPHRLLPTFTGMIAPSIILCHAKNTKEVDYQYEDEPEPLAEAVPSL